MQSRPIRTVAVIMAMRAEARPLLEHIRANERELPETVGPLPIQWHDARVGGLNVVVAVNGPDRRRGVDEIGTQPAALNAYITMFHRRPDLVISAGTAGGWTRHDTHVGDVFVSRDRFVFHDRRITLPGFEQYGIGSYPSVDASYLAQTLGSNKASSRPATRSTSRSTMDAPSSPAAQQSRTWKRRRSRGWPNCSACRCSP